MTSPSDKKLTIGYIAGREIGYVRTRTMVKALERAGFHVVPILPPDKKFSHYPKLLWQFLKSKKQCDVVIVGFYGALLMPFVRLFTRKPVIFDIHSGTHETMIDWEKARPNGLRAAVYFLCDMITMNMADKIILESQDHIRTWSKRYHVPASKFEQVFLASDDDIMVEKSAPVSNNGSMLVHFHGEYAPFHGVEVILRAAHQLKSEDVKFQIIGFGTTYDKDMALAQSLKLDNCRFIRWVPYEELPVYMSRADVCLGFFGDRQRAREVFTNKVVEAIGVKRPLVTMKNAPVSELLTHEKNVLFTEPGSAESLAEAILRLKNDPAFRKKLSENGYAEFQAHCTIDAFAVRLSEIIQKLVRNS